MVIIESSVKQLAGALRHLSDLSTVVFLDRKAEEPPPYRLPAPEKWRYHLVGVARPDPDPEVIPPGWRGLTYVDQPSPPPFQIETLKAGILSSTFSTAQLSIFSSSISTLNWINGDDLAVALPDLATVGSGLGADYASSERAINSAELIMHSRKIGKLIEHFHCEDIERRFVTCGHCEKPLTACWSRGGNTVYPYYLCPTKGCASYGKSIRRETLEEQSEALLLELRPSESMFQMALEMFRELWDSRLAASKTRGKSIESELRATESKIEQFLDRIVDTASPAAITAYEKRISTLEERKTELSEKIANCGRSLESFDETFRTAFAFLGNPEKL